MAADLPDALESEVVTVNTQEGAAFGSALLAAMAGGAFDEISAACQTAIHITDHALPGVDAAKFRETDPVYTSCTRH